MSSGRGAKGSIKDRLISMLYRIRYKEKELKEEEFTVSQKEKQKDYLDTLQRFNEKEDINLIDDKDRKILSETKIDTDFRINPSKEIRIDRRIDLGKDDLGYIKEGIVLKQNNIKIKPRRKKGIGQELDLNVKEFNISKLKDNVDIKKEIKKTKEEITILKEVNSFISKSKETIEEIKKDVEVLKKEVKIKDIDTKVEEEKFIELKKKVEKLKKQFDTVKEKYDLSEFSILESIKLIDSIDNYKSLASLNEMEMMLNVCKKEIDQISGIEIINEEKKKVGIDLNTTKKNQTSVKIKFEKGKEKINDVSSIKEELEYELKIQKKIIDDMYNEASRLEKQITKKLVYTNRGLISSFLRIAGGILTLPLTGLNIFGVAIGTTMINKGLKGLNKAFETREEIEITYDYKDISRQISNVKDKIEYINLVLVDSLSEIRKLKNNFNETFNEYKEILPDYKSTLEDIINLENMLKSEQKKISSMNKKLDEEEKLNEQKIKKVKNNY